MNGESSSHDAEHLLQLGMYSGGKDRHNALCQSTWKDGVMKVEDCRQYGLNEKWESYLYLTCLLDSTYINIQIDPKRKV